MSHTLKIERLGRQGDGIADTGAFVPFALPGESVIASGKGERLRLENIAEPSQHRVSPLCRHFGECGGCQMQHLDHAHYLEWKTGLVGEALARECIETELQPIIGFGAHQRRS